METLKEVRFPASAIEHIGPLVLAPFELKPPTAMPIINPPHEPRPGTPRDPAPPPRPRDPPPPAPVPAPTRVSF